jgi:hypothetical protein
MSRSISLSALLAVSLLGAARADTPKPKADPDRVDITKVKDKIRFLEDDKGHVIAVVPPFSQGDEELEPFFYSEDGKVFDQQLRIGAFRDGETRWDESIWDNRMGRPSPSLEWKDKKYTMTCEGRVTELKPVAPDKASKLLGAEFRKPRWKRQAYAIARDSSGNYFYVDQAREPEGNKDFRVYKGPKGKLQQQKMLNVVSDSEGDIFVTKGGELRLVLDKGEHVWVVGKRRVDLTILPVEDNIKLIYVELGVYAGQRFGTPCDDL